MEYLFFLFVPLGISAWLTRRFIRPSSRFYLLDHPNERSLHSRPTPRTGGLAIVIASYVSGGAAAAIGHGAAQELAWIAATGLFVAGVSYTDDRIGLPVHYRLASHFIAASVLLLGGLQLSGVDGAVPTLPAAITVPLTLLFIVWMINLYNFMDGMDGFAGGMAVVGFGTFAVMGWTAGHQAFSVACMIVATASAGFLVFNFPPARIFMGDVGSSTLGMAAAAFGLWGVRGGVFPFWVVLLVFSPFIMDATVTLLRRLYRREKIWEAHKTHYYQRLVEAGWGHRRTVLLEYLLMLGSSISAVWAVRATSGMQMAWLVCWLLFYALFFLWVGRYTAKRHATRRDGRNVA